MRNDETENQTNLPAVSGYDDGWSATAKEASNQKLIGAKIKYVKGVYSKGGTEMPLNTEWLTRGTYAEWLRWEGDLIAERQGRDAKGRLPARDELGFDDPASWPTNDKTGDATDPWQLTRYLHLIDPRTMEEATFVTTSFWGGDAVCGLARQIENMRVHRPGAQAIIRLQSCFKTSKKYGPIPAPRFEVVSWMADEPQVVEQNPSGYPPNYDMASGGRVRNTTKRVEPPSTAEVLEDEIPF